MSETKTLRLTLDVSYTPNGESIDELVRRLERVVARSVGEGMLTGDTAAEVETWTAKVVETEPPIDEDELAAFMSRRIEDGEWRLEDISVRLARYGQMESTAFIAEMRERMQLATQDDSTAAPRERS